ncbi:FmdB family zinc ribbon protein [Geobacter sp. DSM 9736]|uniref:FmdB family zinc ribbon protein n=1 Tax=Geobacter sp. DSM 9736 TaxID=1277350 RepID=UPI000B51076E|nr:zinc ribbon domain-containing protein [Geobacter sp. DSM 9736]SNB45919.1 putative regulatory protein, FmdB family [Geobacter sp. DSM 9736]
MPVYEYECQSCSNRFELRQKFSDAPANECPTCGGEVKKMISSTAFTLKGGGWYAEGYGAKKSADSAPACASGGSCAGCPSAAA